MKVKLFAIITLISLLLLVSCGSTPTNESEEKHAPEIDDTQVELIEEPVEDVTDDFVEDVVEYAADDFFEDVVEDVFDEDDEYLRSINDIESETVSKEEFNEDKAAILKIIDELSDAMGNFNFDKWKSYISPDSIEYYSNVANLRKVQKKLPDKTIQLKGLKDYFRYVFIPSRQISQVDEIRYISKTSTKAVEVKNDGSLVVYYHFVKINGKWMVSLPDA